MRCVLWLLVVLGVVARSLGAPKKDKKKLDDNVDEMSELYFGNPLVDAGGYQGYGGGQNVYGGGGVNSGTPSLTSQTAIPSGITASSPSISLGGTVGTTSPTTTPTTTPTATPNTASYSTITRTPRFTGTAPTDSSSSTVGPTACWLQLRNRQWIWNTHIVDHEGQLQCGGWVRLQNCQWHWTDQPQHYYPAVCYDMYWNHYGGGGSGGDDGDSPDEGDEDDGPSTAGPSDGPTEDPGGVGGEGGDGDASCSCSDWDFPGDCGTDGMIFRWRTCQPRYCDVEDEYVPCS